MGFILNNLSTTAASKIIVGIFAVIIVVLLINALTPKRVDVEPVIKATEEPLKESKKLLKDAPDENTIPDIKPINDFPVIDLMQSSRQKAESSDHEQRGNEQGINQDIKQSYYIAEENYQQSKGSKSESKEIERGGSQTLDYIKGLNSDNPCYGIDGCTSN